MSETRACNLCGFDSQLLWATHGCTNGACPHRKPSPLVPRAELDEALAALDRARETAVVPQLLTSSTPEPPKPWVVTDGEDVWQSSTAWDEWVHVVQALAGIGRPVYVISGANGG